jgi:hypothetical protein
MDHLTKQFNNSTPVQKAILRDRIRIICLTILNELLLGTDLIESDPAYSLVQQAYDLLDEAGKQLTEDYNSQIKDIIELYEAEKNP